MKQATEIWDARFKVLDCSKQVIFLSQERAKNILWREMVMDVHVNIAAFLLFLVTLQSPPPDENHYPL